MWPAASSSYDIPALIDYTPNVRKSQGPVAGIFCISNALAGTSSQRPSDVEGIWKRHSAARESDRNVFPKHDFSCRRCLPGSKTSMKNVTIKAHTPNKLHMRPTTICIQDLFFPLSLPLWPSVITGTLLWVKPTVYSGWSSLPSILHSCIQDSGARLFRLNRYMQGCVLSPGYTVFN